jgi:hypothetical protein
MIESRACEADCERTDNPDRLFMQRVVNEQLHNVPCIAWRDIVDDAR